VTVNAAARWCVPVGRLQPSPDHRHAGPARSPSRWLAALLAAAVAGAGGATAAGAATGTGGAGTALHAQAARISATIASEDAALATLGERYLAERSAYTAAARREEELRSQIRRIAGSVARDRTDVLAAAVSAYVNAGNDASIGLFLGGTASSLAAGQTYLRVASDQLGEILTRLRDATHSLAVSLATERRAGAAARVALAATAADRSSVLAGVAQQRRLLAGVDGQLAVLVHEQVLARERAAAAAAARVQAAAAAARVAAEKVAAEKAAAAQASPTTLAPPAASGAPAGGGATPPTDPARGPAPAGSAGPPAPSGLPATGSGAIPPGTLSQDFAAIRNCESSDDYTLDTGNGYYGAYQFGLGTWEGLGGTGLPSSAPPAVQDALAYKLYERSGWSPWPECSALIGL